MCACVCVCECVSSSLWIINASSRTIAYCYGGSSSVSVSHSHCDSNCFLICVCSLCIPQRVLCALLPSPSLISSLFRSLWHCRNIALFRCTLQSTFEMYFNLAAASLQFVRVLPSLFSLSPLAVYIVNNIISVKSRGKGDRGEGSSSHTLCAMLIFLASNKVSWLFSAVNVQLSRDGDRESEKEERGEKREGSTYPCFFSLPTFPSPYLQ